MGAGGNSFCSLKMLLPLRNRDFRLLWTGMTASLVGDGVFLVALAWQVYQLSNAPTALSVVGVAVSLPHVLFLLAGGVASDRVDRRRLMIAADVVRGAAMGALGLLAAMGALHLWQVIILGAVKRPSAPMAAPRTTSAAIIS